MECAEGIQAGANTAGEDRDQLAKDILEVQKKLEQSTVASKESSQSGQTDLYRSSFGLRNLSHEEQLSITDVGGTERVEPPLVEGSLSRLIAGDQAEVVSDATGETHSSNDDDAIDFCLCERLLVCFETDENLVANHLSCHCRGSGNYDCHLQLQLPMSQPSSAHDAPVIIMGPPRKSSISPRYPGIPTRKRSGVAMRLFRLQTREEHQCD